MEVVLFRHGIAEDRESFDGPDAERSLTERGVERTRHAAAGLVSLWPVLGTVAASPYRRARETADVIASVYGEAGCRVTKDIVEDLRPGGSPDGICHWLGGLDGDGRVMLVGHEPDLSLLMAWLTAGRTRDYARFKKAGACLIEFTSEPERGGGELQWLLTPAVLRRLAG